MFRFDREKCEGIVEMALAEDVVFDDITSRLLIDEGCRAKGKIVAKEEGVLAGMPVVEMVFDRVDGGISVDACKEEGDAFSSGETLAVVEGPARGILSAERTALNFLQQLCGVATAARRLAEVFSRYGVILKDTRKTLPGWRWLQKYAVRVGGGENHRMDLADSILIKDNHLRCLHEDRMEAIALALAAVKPEAKDTTVEIEVETVEEARLAMEMGVDIVMLDNMDVADMKICIELARNGVAGNRPLVEISGTVTDENAEEIARLRPDWVSVGSITHSCRAVDISLEI